MRVARRYRVSGRVQGVGFRYFTQDIAEREGIAGSVRNLPDGRVEVMAEGDAETLDRLEAALWRGPSHARVEHVEVESTVPTGRHTGFRAGEMETLRARIRHVPDFPKPGILFYDITTLLNDPQGFREMIDALASPYREQRIEQVVGIESRGFILGAAVANELHAGFVPIRKPGKLPSKTHREDYALEYGTDCLEIHQDAFEPGQKVLLVDDVLATGGTAKAASGLIRRIGGDLVGLSFLIELDFLNGRSKLANENVYSVLKY